MPAVTLRELLGLLRIHYVNHRCGCMRTYDSQIKSLLAKLGNTPAEGVTWEIIEGYKAARLQAGYAPQTVNHELKYMRQAFKVGSRARKISPGLIPHIELIPVFAMRTGTISPEEFRRIHREMTSVVARDICEFAYSTGWRFATIKELRWHHVHRGPNAIVIPPEINKNRKAQRFPLQGRLDELIRRRERERHGEFVFHRFGKQVKTIRDSWESARERAGLPHALFHDMRRTFCSNGIRAGLPQLTVMALSGHRSSAVFARYCILDDRELRAAAARIEAEAFPPAAATRSPASSR